MSGEFVRIRPVDVGPATPKDERGWRLRVYRPEDDHNVNLYDEQTFPERVTNPNASHFKHQTRIIMTSDEQVWLRDALTELIGDWADVEALKTEILSLRSTVRELRDARTPPPQTIDRMLFLICEAHDGQELWRHTRQDPELFREAARLAFT